MVCNCCNLTLGNNKIQQRVLQIVIIEIIVNQMWRLKGVVSLTVILSPPVYIQGYLNISEYNRAVADAEIVTVIVDGCK